MIPDITALNFPKKDGKQYATLTHASIPQADMGEKTITTQVKIDGDIVPDFSFDWEVEFQEEKYIMPLRIPQGAKENTSLNSTIDLTFQHWAIYQLKRWPFVTIQQIAAGTYLPDEEVATVQLNLGDFCILFGQVLKYYYGDAIKIDLNPAWQYKQEATIITISHTKIWNVLIDAFHGKYGVRWEIKAASDNSNTVKGGERYVIRVGYPTTEVGHIFEYGFEGGLLKVERQVQSEEIHNMLKGRGGDTNIPFRYFKNTDPNNPDFRPDPDWVEELANIYFPDLMPATFRSYVQGWKAAHISKYPGYTAVGENNAYAPWAYRKGYTDTKFSPVEFVADEITISPATSDKQVEILPGYSPYVKKGSSLDKYGPLPDTLDNNDDIYPTLQGTGLDIAVAVEQIESDDVIDSVESDAQTRTLPVMTSATVKIGKEVRKEISFTSDSFNVPEGEYANLDEGVKSLALYKEEKRVVWNTRSIWSRPSVETIDVTVNDETLVQIEDPSIVAIDVETGEIFPASGLPSGNYYLKVNLTLYNTSAKELKVVVTCESPKIVTATASEAWTNTFSLWVKNVWNTSRATYESESQYSERVWKPVLGDRQGNTAKVLFTTGALAHEDYEFTIVGFPVPDATKSWVDEDGVTHTSHWRIKLAKSDAELEATGLYVPSTQKQGKAGDSFVFIGTEMTHVPYVVDAEIRLDDGKKDQLGEVKEIKPTAVVTTDRVRLNNEGKPDALINQLRVGNSVRLFDKRFFNEPGKAYETLYLQSITYTYREPSSDDAALNPDVEIVLSNEYATSANPVSMMQGEISALQKQVGSISNIEQIVRAVGDKLYLRKDGISDISLSPTQFFSLLTSGDFRTGLIGGAGWGFYKDENDNWVLETDRVNVRQEMQVNTLVINQAEGRGGMEIDTAAYIDGVTRVVETENGYICYFDQKEGSIANLFHVDDVAYCNRWTPENAQLKFYKRRVIEVGANYITLSKADVNGTGVPSEKDNIIHFGNYTDATRQYVKVRDIVGGGYERYIEALNSVNAEGVEYYFVGKQAGKSRWFVGNKDLVPYSGDGNGSYIEYADGTFKLNNVSLSVGSTIDNKPIEDYVSDNLDVGGTNLAKDSDVVSNIKGGESNGHDYILCQSLSVGRKYTITAWVESDGYSLYIKYGTKRHLIPHDTASGIRKYTFVAEEEGVTNILLYAAATAQSFVINKIKLEVGAVSTDWSPCPDSVEEKTSYLRKALKESTNISGGLVVASLLQLGYTVDEAGFVTRSGVNGIVDNARLGGGIAFWAGGNQIDAEEEEVSELDFGEPATFAVRMNGSGYMAGGTVRFRDKELLLGDNLRLSENELYMVTDESGKGFAVQARETGFSNLDNATSPEATININRLVNAQNIWHSPTSQSYFISTVFPNIERNIGRALIGGKIKLTLKARFRLSFGTSAGTVIPSTRGRITPKLYDANGIVHTFAGYTWARETIDTSTNTYDFYIDYYDDYTITANGVYRIVIESFDQMADDPNGYATPQQITQNFKIVSTDSEVYQTIIGTDGFASNWGKTLLAVSETGAIMRYNNFYIKVTANGIRYNGGDGEKQLK